MESNIQFAVCAWPGLSVKVAEKLTGVPTVKTAPLSGPVIVTVGLGLLTVTVAVHWLDVPLLSVTVSVTVVMPSGYGPAGDCVMVIGSPSGSKEPLSSEALAVQFALAETVTFWQIAVGGLLPHLPAPPALKIDWISLA